MADLMRRLGICEELGSGLDKAVAAIELFQLPPLRFTVQEARTIVTLFAYRKYANLDRQERIYACYQHACLKYVTNDKMTNLTLWKRLGIDKQNYPMASRIIKDALIAGKIKEEKTENQSRNNKGYVPFWA
jgi:predicted HTH transcriptional regulator